MANDLVTFKEKGGNTMAAEHQFRSVPAKTKYGSGAHLWDQVLFESQHFVAIPTLGHLVQGWLLVVPKDCHICVGALPVQLIEELIGFLDDVVSSVRAEYGPVAVFEHGPVRPLTAVGCGVDYAHVHVVPVKGDWSLLKAAKTMAPQIQWEMVLSLHDTRKYFEQSRSYLFLHEPFAVKPVMGTGPSIPSQLFRRIIANYVDRPHDFDWKKYPEVERIQSTVERLQKSARSIGGVY